MANEKTNKFDRSVCFTFFKNYLDQAEAIKNQLGAEKGYNFLTGIAKYGLFQEESEDETTKAMVDSLRYGIDSSQAKRQRTFEGWWN